MAHHTNRERGSISIYVAMISIAMILLVGMVVDLSGQVRARQYAEAVAAEAARVAGQQIDPVPAIEGQGVAIRPAAAQQAGQAYLAGAGMTGTVSATATEVVVDTTETYQPIILSAIGIGTLQAKGHAVARITDLTETFEGTGIDPVTNQP